MLQTIPIGGGSRGIQSAFVKLDQAMIRNALGLELPEGVTLKLGGGRKYVELPISMLLRVSKDNEEKEVLTAGVRGQHVEVLAAGVLKPKNRNYTLLVEPNPALSVFGCAQGSYFVHSAATESETIPSVKINLLRGLSAEEMASMYAVRVYVML